MIQEFCILCMDGKKSKGAGPKESHARNIVKILEKEVAN